MRTFKMLNAAGEYEGVVFSNGRVAIQRVGENAVSSWDSMENMLLARTDSHVFWDDEDAETAPVSV